MIYTKNGPSLEPLYPREWLAILGLTLFCLALTKFALSTPESRWPHRNGDPVPVPKEKIVVYFSGAVASEGRYHFDKGTTLQEALESITIMPEADLSNQNLDKVLSSGQKIKIPKKKYK